MKSYVIFDLDGTLLNTIDDLAAATNHALEQFGFPTHGDWAYPAMVGNGVRKLIERALPVDARSEETVAKVLAVFTEYYSGHCCDATKPYPGIPELIADFTARGINLAVTSNKYKQAVDIIVSHYFPDGNFRAILGHTDGMPRKPDPSIVFAILNKYPTPKADVLYVGDSAVDMETARRACIESVGVTWGFRPVSELRGAYADHIVSATTEILSIAGMPQ